MVKVLLLVSDPYIAIQLLSCLRDCRADVAILDFTGNGSLRFSRICRSYRQVAVEQIRLDGFAAAKMLDELAGEYGVELALAAGMDATLLLARAKSYVKKIRIFPMADANALSKLNNKWYFAKLCEQLGLKHPRSVVLSGSDAVLPEWYQGQAVVLKPLSQSGSRGVRTIKSPDLLRKLLTPPKTEGAPSYLVQEYVPGKDGVLGVLALNGRLVASSLHLYADGQHSVRFYNLPAVIAMGEAIVAARSLTGIFEFDLRRDERDGSWWLIECNPRFWASVALASFAGVNFVQLGIKFSSDTAPPNEMLPAPSGEWLRFKELIRRLRRDGLSSLRDKEFTWKGLHSTWSDPVPSFLIRRRSQEHDLQ